MKEYAEFIKEGNFSPMTVLDPDLGMDGEIFAKDKTKGRGKEETIEAGGNSSLEAAHTNMSELLNKIEETAKSTGGAFKAVYDDPFEKRHKGRRKKFSDDTDMSKVFGINQNITNNHRETNSQSSGYISQIEMQDESIEEVDPLPEDPNYLLDENLLGMMSEKKHKFQSSFNTGEAAIKIFIDRTNPHNKTAHPALPNVLKEMNELQLKIGDFSSLLCNFLATGSNTVFSIQAETAGGPNSATNREKTKGGQERPAGQQGQAHSYEGYQE